ncbi:hypothetical protein MERGE_002755 [Pneumocystis wakefieldiae]|uniref:RecA family profile 1 domain-containing protein n=1 Tax=Pneumocystis wakefieldiae TaxID=38082 RepID=A0A899FYS8_9ASCO|nr:hypothetical protein MERGE_002755 [Pneumocystis wakefieldiae]
MVALDILVKGFDEYYEIVKMLSNVHIFTDDELLLCDIEYISKRIDIPLDKINEFINIVIVPSCAAKSIRGDMDCQLSDFMVNIKCSAIDDVLNGGFPTGRIITISGPSEIGKTTIAYSVVCSYLSCKNARAIWIDTSGTFSVQRLIDIARQRNYVHGSDFLERIGIVRAFDIWGIMDGINEFHHLVNKSIDNHNLIPGIIVIDNITNPLSFFMQREQIKGHSIMVSLVHNLHRISCQNRKVLVLLINSTVKLHLTNFSAFSSTELKPALGITWSYLSDLDILITKAPDNVDYSSANILEVIFDRYGTLLGRWGLFTIVFSFSMFQFLF